LPPDIFPLYFSSQRRLGPFLCIGPVCPLESFWTTFNLHWSGLPRSISCSQAKVFKIRFTCPFFPRLRTCPFVPLARTCLFFPRLRTCPFGSLAKTCPFFPRLRTCPFVPLARTCPFFPKAEDLSVRAARQDLSVFPKTEDLSNFQVWDIGQVPVSNFDWLPFTPPSGRLLRSFVQCISFLLFLLLTLDERQISYSRSK
jgi:hypothetical protein